MSQNKENHVKRSILKKMIMVWSISVLPLLLVGGNCVAATFQCRLTSADANGTIKDKVSYELTIIAKGKHTLDITVSNIEVTKVKDGKKVHPYSNDELKKEEKIKGKITRNDNGSVQSISVSFGKTTYPAKNFWFLDLDNKNDFGRTPASLVLSLLRNVVFDLPKHVELGLTLNVPKRNITAIKQDYSSMDFPNRFFAVGIVNQGHSIQFRAAAHQKREEPKMRHARPKNQPKLPSNMRSPFDQTAYVMETGKLVIEKKEHLIARHQTWSRWSYFTQRVGQKPYYFRHTIFKMKPTQSK